MKLVKRHILRFNQANPDSMGSFLALKNGTKKVETRAASDAYRGINEGDVLVFVCGKMRFIKKVKSVRRFKSISSLLRVYRITDIMPNKRSRRDLEHAYFSYPAYKEKIKKFGLIAFEIK